jgi:agmatine deiminase
MPAEWQPHEATWLTWPTNRTTWPGRMLTEVESIYLQMMAALLPGERVHLLVPDERTGRQVLGLLAGKRAAVGNLVLHEVKTVDTWIRDYGPIFVKRHARQSEDGVPEDVAFCKFTFNAWGNKYRDLARDNGVVDRIEGLRAFKRFDVPAILEGGSIDTNGLGTCLTTEQCLLNPNRACLPDKPGKRTREELEALLEGHLGVTNVIWLREGIEGDDTDGHVDDITRFVASRRVVTAVEPDTRDKNHAYLEENLGILKSARDQDGRKLEIIELPMPGRLEVQAGHSSSGRLPASYANFYIGNAAVLVPVYGHSNDKEALSVLRKLFPDRKVVGIECTALVYGLGSIHCVTQQQPA